MARCLYSLFFYLILPLILLRLLYRACKAPAYRRRIKERFGLFNPPENIHGAIWVHAVSVGETIAAAPLIEQLSKCYPDSPIVVTTMTPTGSERVQALFGNRVFHVYAPYDFPDSVWRFLNRIQPSLLIILETELWPNTINQCYQRNIPVVLANARLSENSAKGYRRFRALVSPMFKQLSMVAAQHKDDGERFLQLDLPPEKLTITGSIKFDVELSADIKQQAAALKLQLSDNGNRKILIAASTHEGEDKIIFDAFKKVLKISPKVLLILVPRHPERFNGVVTLANAKGFKTIRRSGQINLGLDEQILIGDTMGELLLLYGCSDISFVGGSLVPVGGHNSLEPALWGLPIITGESDFNFLEISRQLQQSGGMKKINTHEELADAWIALLNDRAQCQVMGESAALVIENNRGALKKLLTVIDEHI